MASIDRRLEYLEDIASQLEQGAFTMPTALGPNKLSKNTIKGKSITGVMIDANDLSAIKTSTGSLSVTGNLTIGTGGSLRSGKTDYADTVNAGYFIGLDVGTPKIRVGNAGHTKGFTWNGTTLDIVGSITADTGTIGGWTIGSTDLTADSAATGIASSGSYRLWIGDATPASAEFSVTSAGAMKSTSGAIGGWTINDINGLSLGSGASTRGISTGSTAFYAGNATPSSAPFRVTTGGQLTATDAIITGAITATSGSFTGSLSAVTGTLGALTVNGTLTLGTGSISSTNWSITSAGVMTAASGTIGGLTINANDITIPSGKKIKFGASGTDFLTNNALHFEMTGSETTKIDFSTTSLTPTGAMVGYIDINNALTYLESRGTVNRYATVATLGSNTNVGTYAYIKAVNTSSVVSQFNIVSDGSLSYVSAGSTRLTYTGLNWEMTLGDTAGVNTFMVRDSGGTPQFGVNSDGQLIRPLANDATAEGAYHGRIPIYINGSLKYISVHDA